MQCLVFPGLLQLCLFLLHLTWIRPVFGEEKNDDLDDGLGPLLRPIRPEEIDPQLVMRRDANDLSILDPLDVDNFVFGNPSDDEPDFKYLNMTIYTDDHERILSLEHIEPKLKSVECGMETVLTFGDKQAFNYAAKAWNWVNDHDSHRLFLITDHPNCAATEERQLYLVTDMESDADKLVIHLTGEKKDWASVVHDADIQSGVVQRPRKSGKRGIGDWEKTLGPVKIPLRFEAEDFDIFRAPAAATKCVKCTFHGTLEVSFSIGIRNFKPNLGTLNVNPKDFSMDAALRAESHASMGNFAYLKMKGWGRPIPRLGIRKKFNFGVVKGVFQAGVMVYIFVYIALYGWEGKGYVDFGVHSTLANTAHLGIELGNFAVAPIPTPGMFDLKGIDVTNKWKPVKSDLQGQAHISVDLAPDIGVDIDVLGIKFGFGTYVNIPKFMLDIDGRDLKERKSNTACRKKKTEGLDVALNWGIGWLARVGLSGDVKNVIAYTINDEPFLSNHDKRSPSRLQPRKFGLPSLHGTDPEKILKNWQPPIPLSAILNIGDWTWNIWERCYIDAPDKSEKPSSTKSSEKKPSSTKSSEKPSSTKSPEKNPCKLKATVRYRPCLKTTKECPAAGQVKKGTKVKFECQKSGESVEGLKAWGKLEDKKNAWMSLKYISAECRKTIPKCGPKIIPIPLATIEPAPTDIIEV